MPLDTDLRVAICGSGNRSRSVWQRHLTNEPGFELVGVQDPESTSLEKAFAGGFMTPQRAFSELDAMLDATVPDVLIVCPPNEFHAAAIDAQLLTLRPHTAVKPVHT